MWAYVCADVCILVFVYVYIQCWCVCVYSAGVCVSWLRFSVMFSGLLIGSVG